MVAVGVVCNPKGASYVICYGTPCKQKVGNGMERLRHKDLSQETGI